jgi:hypothetical protein
MRKFVWACVFSVSCLWGSLGEAAIRATLDGQIHSLANDVKKNLKENPLVMGQPLQLAKFEGTGDASVTNFGQRIEQLLKTELSTVLQEKSKYTLTGAYQFVAAEDPSLKKAKILLVTAQIKDDRDRQLASISVEINDTDNIMQALGLTSAAPAKNNATFQERNDTVKEAQTNPTFDIEDKTRVAAKGATQWSIGLLKKPIFDGPSEPVTPENVNGLAFAPVAVGEYYEIEIVNLDKSDTVVMITVDGLEVVNAFSDDKDASGKPIHWPGYYVPANKKVVIRGWLHTVDQKAKDNVFAFRVNELGQGAATALKTRGTVGVITAQFREATSPTGKLSGRSVGETAKGEGLKEEMTSQPVQIGENVLSTVSIRYNRPQ